MLKRGAIWLRDFRQTKVFDLLAASPLMVWFLLGLREQAPLTGLRLTLNCCEVQSLFSISCN